MSYRFEELSDGVFALVASFDQRFTCNIGIVVDIEALIQAAETDTAIRTGPWSNWFDPWGEPIAHATNRINRESSLQPDAIPPTLIQLLSD